MAVDHNGIQGDFPMLIGQRPKGPKRERTRLLNGVAALICGAMLAAPVAAESPAAFYKGKSVTLLVGGSPCGGYATYAGILARHMGRHIPGKPRIVAKSMPGAGSLKALKVLYKRSKKDGTVMAAVFQGALMEPLLGKRGVEFDALKLNYIGELNSEPKICIAWHKSPVKRFEDLQKTEMIVGASGATSGLFQYATVLKNVLGAKLKVIAGYKGSAGASLAMQRGETQGMCGYSWSSFATKHNNWIVEKKVRILTQIGQKPVPRLTKMGVPQVWKFVKSPDERKAMELIFNPPGRPYIMPPGVPADRVQAVRAAFMATTRDAKFMAEAKKARIRINPSPGAKVEALMRKLYASTPEVVKIAKAALSRRGTVKCKEFTNPKYCRSKKKKKKKKQSS